MSATDGRVDGESPVNLESSEEHKTEKEIEIDMLIAHELATGSAAAGIIWQAVQLQGCPASLPTVVRQHPFDGRSQHRSADIRAMLNGISVLIEDKGADGRFEEGQAEDYRDYRRDGHCDSTVLIAPRRFWEANEPKVKQCFAGWVLTEDLACKLLDAVTAGDVDNPELAASYRYRAQRLLECSKLGPASPIDPTKADFFEVYRDRVDKLGIKRLKVTLTGPKEKTTSVSFDKWVEHGGNAEYRPYHELPRGYVWLRIPNYKGNLRGLRTVLGGFPPLPSGWTPDQRSGKYPGLFFELPPLKREDLNNHDIYGPVIDTAREALASLSNWWDKGGNRLHEGGK